MTRLFRRGELQAAVLDVLALVGPANGYTIMQELGSRVGDQWQPSPGAVYPALLGLHDAGLIVVTEHDGSRDYALSAAGQRAAKKAAGIIEDVANRARLRPRTVTVGAVLDEFAAGFPHRHQTVSPLQQAHVLAELEAVRERLDNLLEET
jgi:DNA-binding PadR family transcriptional regulator